MSYYVLYKYADRQQMWRGPYESEREAWEHAPMLQGVTEVLVTVLVRRLEGGQQEERPARDFWAEGTYVNERGEPIRRDGSVVHPGSVPRELRVRGRAGRDEGKVNSYVAACRSRGSTVRLLPYVGTG